MPLKSSSRSILFSDIRLVPYVTNLSCKDSSSKFRLKLHLNPLFKNFLRLRLDLNSQINRLVGHDHTW